MSVFFKKENLKKTIFTICYLVLGLLFCVLPTRMFNFAEFVLCYLLFVAGIICVVFYSLMPGNDKEFKVMIFGILGLLFGLFIMLWPKFLGLSLSAIICYSGVSLIVSGLKQKKEHKNEWVTEFVVGIVVSVLALATAILSGTNTAKNILAVFIGIMLLLNGVLGLSELIVLAKKEKKLASDTLENQSENSDDNASKEG